MRRVAMTGYLFFTSEWRFYTFSDFKYGIDLVMN